MSVQLTLLSDSPVARSSDFSTSHEAAERVTKDGTRAQQQNLTLGAVQKWNGRTSAELADILKVSRFLTARRLPELRAAGFVENGPPRDCRITGRSSLTWWIRGTAPREAA